MVSTPQMSQDCSDPPHCHRAHAAVVATKRMVLLKKHPFVKIAEWAGDGAAQVTSHLSCRSSTWMLCSSSFFSHISFLKTAAASRRAFSTCRRLVCSFCTLTELVDISPPLGP